MSAYIKKRPIIFGLLLILLNQGISDLLTEEVQDSPPNFPSSKNTFLIHLSYKGVYHEKDDIRSLFSIWCMRKSIFQNKGL